MEKILVQIDFTRSSKKINVSENFVQNGVVVLERRQLSKLFTSYEIGKQTL